MWNFRIEILWSCLMLHISKLLPMQLKLFLVQFTCLRRLDGWCMLVCRNILLQNSNKTNSEALNLRRVIHYNNFSSVLRSCQVLSELSSTSDRIRTNFVSSLTLSAVVFQTMRILLLFHRLFISVTIVSTLQNLCHEWPQVSDSGATRYCYNYRVRFQFSLLSFDRIAYCAFATLFPLCNNKININKTRSGNIRLDPLSKVTLIGVLFASTCGAWWQASRILCTFACE